MSSKAVVLVMTSFPSAGDGREAAGSFVCDFADALSKHLPVRVEAPSRIDGIEVRELGVEVFRHAAPIRPLFTLKTWRVQDVLDILRVLRVGMRATERAVAVNFASSLMVGLLSGWLCLVAGNRARALLP